MGRVGLYLPGGHSPGSLALSLLLTRLVCVPLATIFANTLVVFRKQRAPGRRRCAKACFSCKAPTRIFICLSGQAFCEARLAVLTVHGGNAMRKWPAQSMQRSDPPRPGRRAAGLWFALVHGACLHRSGRRCVATTGTASRKSNAPPQCAP